METCSQTVALLPGPLTILSGSSSATVRERVNFRNWRSTVKIVYAIHKSLRAKLHTGARSSQPIQETQTVLLVGWQLPAR
jgi:hypothetical protein